MERENNRNRQNNKTENKQGAKSGGVNRTFRGDGTQKGNRTFREDGTSKGNRTFRGDGTSKTDRASRGDRTTAVSLCPVTGKCGGCQLLDCPYDKQLKQKQEKLAELMKPFGKPEPFIGMEDPFHYRHKVHAVFDRDRRGNVISGVYKAGTHFVVPVEKCYLENEKADAIIGTIRGMLKAFKIKTYDEDSGYGLLRHVLIRVGQATGQIMVVLVLASPILPSRNHFVKALLAEHPEITTVVLNVNDRRTSMVLGDKEQAIYGPGYIEDELCGMRFRISPKSFYQVNPVQTKKLYEKAMEYAGLTGKETVLDAYCGTGTIGMLAARQAGEVIGVELNKDAVRDAIINARRNQVENIQFYQKDAGEFMLQLAAAGKQTDVVFLDPPRTGSSEAFLKAMTELSPKKIVYVSCNPQTLVRDLEYLTHRGYRVRRSAGVDMFPHTTGIETVISLSRKTPDDHIEIDLDLDELDATSAETKATYEEIKEYVLKETGLKVSSLYISQIKRKCGLEVGENYNLAKDENARIPQCPPDKEKAIRAALKHFAMI